VFKFDDKTLFFIDNGTLINRNLSTNINHSLKTGLGNKTMRYATAAGRLFFCNSVFNGSVANGEYQDWGVARPPSQPVLSTAPVGGLFAGIYFAVITWLRKGEESGTGAAAQIEVPSGGGIVLSQFPLPPAEVDQVAVYVTPCNGKHLYLYGEYPAAIQSVTVGQHISGIELTTQFGKPPTIFSFIATHNGRIYGARKNRVHYSEPLNYGVFMPNNYFLFNADVELIAAVQGALYVVADKTWRIGDINQEGIPAVVEVLPFGGCGNVAYDPAQTMAVWMSDGGFVIATAEGVTLLAEDRIAVGDYSKGAVTVIEQDGCKRVVGTFK
jgi:hypothetical protein